MDQAWLNIAIDAVRQNDRTRARELLIGYVRHHSRDEQGWLWLSRVTERREDKIQYLQRALKINPNCAAALAELAAIGVQVAPPRQPAPTASTARPSASARPARPQASPPVSRPTARLNAPAAGARTRPSIAAPPRPAQRHWLGAALNGTIVSLAAMLFVAVAIAIVPMFIGARSLVILSGSMEPTISTGSVVVVQPMPSKNLAVGDVIAFTPNPDAPVPIVHRIVKIEERNGVRYYTTRGDANTSADAEVALPPTAWRMQFHLPFVGYIISYANSPAGIVVLIVLPLLALLALSVHDWLNKRRAAFRMSSNPKIG